MVLTGTLAFGQKPDINPKMDSKGKISCGSKSIWIKEGYSQINMIIADTTSIFGSSIFNFGKVDTSPCFFLNKKKTLTNNSVAWTSDITAARGEKEIIGKYTISLVLQKDNLIKVSFRYKLNPGVKTKQSYFYMGINGAKMTGNYNTGSEKIDLSSKKYHYFNESSDLTFNFFPDSTTKEFRIIPKIYSKGVVNIPASRIGLYPKNGNIEFLLDLRGEKQLTRSSEYYGGTDFEKIDHLHLPQYKRCRNLIQNPSFEEGMRSYGYKTYGTFYRPENNDIYSIDDQSAKFGTSSLRIKALKKLSLPIATMAIPVTQGKKYILSFYAKGNLPNGLALRLDGRSTKVYWMFANKGQPIIGVSDKWERYNVSFDSLSDFYSIYFRGFLSENSNEKEGVVWIDGLQLEEEKLTDYTEKPFAVQLTSAARGNFLKFQQKPEFKFILKAKALQQGSVNLQVKDFFSKEIFNADYKFKTDKNGEVSIKLSKLDNKTLTNKLRGVFIVKSLITVNGIKKPYRDYFRFSIMNFLDNKYKNKNIFCFTPLYSNIMNSAGVNRRLARFRDIGFGSAVYVNIEDLKIEKWLVSKIKEYGIDDTGREIVNKLLKNVTIREGEMEISNIRNMINPSPEKLKEYEKICELRAKTRPWISTWYFAGEVEGMKPLVEDPESIGKIIVAGYKGIKKGNPKAKVHMGGAPWNINKNGRDWYDKFLKAVRDADPSIKFDGTEIHIYNEMPESPDLDAETASYIKMLKKYGYENKPIYWDEGMNYFEYFLPKEAMTPYYGNSGDSWYPGMLTYDMGRAERISAAFSARTWLIAFKHMKNIACLLDFSMRRYFWDIDLTVGAKMKVVNTIGRILGNASFYKDIRFAPKVRCYMFIDENKRPVAAIWGYDTAVDKWEKAAPVFKFDFSKQNIKYLDLMETKCKFPVKNGYTQIPLGSFPLFIIGEPGTEKILAESIAKGKKLSGSLVPIKISAMPVSLNKAEVKFTNELTSPLKAQAVVNGKKYKLDLKEQEVLRKNISLSQNSNVLKKFKLSASIKSAKYLKNKKEIDGIFTFIPEASITFDGKDGDWEKIPAIKISSKTSIKLAICKKTLCIAIQNNDKNLSNPTLLINSTPSDKDWFGFKTREQDVYVYEIRKQKNGTLKAFAHYVPFVQSASGPWTPKGGRVSRYISGKAGNDFLEIAVSASAVMPLKLKKGEKIGLNIVFKKGKSILSLAPIKNYLNPKEPGSFKLILSFIK